MLSDNCKEVLYPTLDIFRSNYFEKMFSSKKTCATKLWSEKTYRVELRENLMSTGEYKDSYIQDFYTVKSGKLNIDGYVKRKVINKSETKDLIKISIKSIDFFVDYTQVNYTILNETNSNIILSNAEDNKEIVLVDEKKNEYESNVTEFPQSEFIINKQSQKEVTLTYNVSYIKDLEFSSSIFYNIEKEEINNNMAKNIKIKIEV